MGETHRSTARHRRGREPLIGTLVAAVGTVAVPVAVTVVPNLSGLIMPGLLDELDAAPSASTELIRAYGVGLPALLASVPAGAWLCTGRRPAGPLVSGFALVAVAELASLLPPSAPLIEAVRALHGVGGGLLLPASLTLALQRGGRMRVWLTGWWAVVLLVGLFAAAPLAQLVLAADGWRASLWPFPWLVALGLLFGVPLLALPGVGGTRMRAADRILVLVPSGLAVGTAALILGTIRGWSGTAQLAAAGILLVGYLALALSGGAYPEPASRTALPLVAVATGGTVSPMVGGALGMRTFAAGVNGPASAPWALAVPLCAAVVMAGLGVVAGTVAHRRGWPGCPVGLVSHAVGLLITVAGGTVVATVAWALIAGGLGLAWGTALTGLPRGGALFAIQLVFPSAAAGHLLCGVVQLWSMRGMGQRVPVDAAGFQTMLATGEPAWPLIAGTFVALCAVGATVLRRGAPARAAAEGRYAEHAVTEVGPAPVHR